MIKVVIADDEIRVCQLISRLIQWESLEMECVAIVHDGISALHAIEQYRPQIVITDIRMPGYDGLELIAKAKEVDPSIKFIIISGYSNFEYTQSAIRYDASDYILKPIKKEELNKTLEKVKRGILEAMDQNVLAQQTNAQAKMRLHFIREKLLLDGWQDQVDEDQFRTHFDSSVFGRIFVIQMDGYFSQERGLQIKHGLDDIFTSMDKINGYQWQTILARQTIVGWLGCNEVGAKKMDRDIRYTLQYLQNQIHLKPKEYISLGAGNMIQKGELIQPSFKSCQFQIYRRWTALEHNCFIDHQAVVDKRFELQRILEENQRRLTSMIDELNVKGMQDVFKQIKDDLETVDYLWGYEFYLWLKSLATLIQADFLPSSSIVVEIDQFAKETLYEIEISHTTGEAYGVLERNTLNMIKAILAGKKTIESKPIRQAKRYIEMHYQHEISLESISQEFGLSAPYFSALFKREVGQKFIDYLTQIRIERSKDLLRDSSLNISEICVEIGYNDQKHFNAQFKKITGLKPSEYRKIYA